MNMEEVLQSEEFLAEVKAAASAEDVAKLFNAKGIDVTAAELEAAMKNDNDELDETALDDVAGGINIGMVLNGVSNVIIGKASNNKRRVAQGVAQIVVGLKK